MEDLGIWKKAKEEEAEDKCPAMTELEWEAVEEAEGVNDFKCKLCGGSRSLKLIGAYKPFTEVHKYDPNVVVNWVIVEDCRTLR